MSKNLFTGKIFKTVSSGIFKEEEACITPQEISSIKCLALAVIAQAVEDANNKIRPQFHSQFYPSIENKKSAKRFLSGGLELENWATIADISTEAVSQSARRQGLIV